jgi:propanol-preferring alcohol dehydrogenase
VPGHEYVGRIESVGPGVDPARLGERVAAYFYLFCGSCRWCLAGQESLCERLGGYVGVDVDGGYAPVACLPARNAVAIPEGIDADAATAVPDAVATPVHVATVARITVGDRVAVIGAGGGVGIHMVQVARLFGAEVIGLEVAAVKREVLQRELDFECLDSTDFGAVRLPERWVGGADVVVDLVGSEQSLSWSVAAVRNGGRVVMLTTFRGISAAVSPRDLVLRQISLLGSRYASRRELLMGADLVASGRLRPFVTDRAGVDSVEALHEKLKAGALLGRGVLDWVEDDRPVRPSWRGKD